MARRPKPVPQMTVAQFEATFPDEDACKAYLQAAAGRMASIARAAAMTKVFSVSSMPFKWQCYKCARAPAIGSL